MSEGYVRLPQDSSGKRMRAVSRNVGGVSVYEEVVQGLTRSIAEVPPNKSVTKMRIGEDVNGNIREIKFFDGVELLFTLTFSNAGSVVTEYDIERS